MTFNEPIAPSTLEVTDFTLNGIPADSLVIVSPTEVDFQFSSPVGSPGANALVVGPDITDSAGNPMDQDEDGVNGEPLQDQFLATLTIDPAGARVVLASPTGTVPGPVSTVTVTFNEAIDTATFTAADVTASGPGGAITVIGVSPVSLTQFVIVFPSQGQAGNYTFVLGPAIADSAGHLMDQNQNGVNGEVPGDRFTMSFAIALCEPITALGPLIANSPPGSFIYDVSVSGAIDLVCPTDRYIINIDGGQAFTIGVEPGTTLQPTIQLKAPSGAVIGQATATAAGQNAVLQGVPTVTGGLYTVEVSGSGTVGPYDVQLVLNANLEEEAQGLGANDTPATAQDIGAPLLTVPPGYRAGVLGQADGGATSYFASQVEFAFQDISATGTRVLSNANNGATKISPPGWSFRFYDTPYTSLFVSSNGLITLGSGNASSTNSDLTSLPTQAAIAPFWDDLLIRGSATSAVYWQLFGSGANQQLIVQWNDVSFAPGADADRITFQVILMLNNNHPSIQFNYVDLLSSTAGSEGSSATVGIKAAGAQGADRLLLAFDSGPNQFVGTGLSTRIDSTAPPADYYRFDLNAGDTTTIAGTSLSAGGNVGLSVVDSDGQVLAVASSTIDGNVDEVVFDYAAPVTGTYYAQVTGGPGTDYSLLVTRNAVPDIEPFGSRTNIKVPLGSNDVPFGWVGGTTGGDRRDEFLLPLTAGEVLDLATSTPADGPGEFTNPLNPQISVYGPDGSFLVTGTPMTDGRNEALTLTVPVTGTYRIRIAAEGGTSGVYVINRLTPP